MPSIQCWFGSRFGRVDKNIFGKEDLAHRAQYVTMNKENLIRHEEW